MHTTILTQRKSTAYTQIVDRTQALAEKLKVDQATIEKLTPSFAVKDQDVVELMRLEAIGEVLTAIAKKSGIKEPKPEDTSVNTFMVAPEDQATAVPLAEPVVEQPAPKAKATRTSRAKPKTTAKG